MDKDSLKKYIAWVVGAVLILYTLQPGVLLTLPPQSEDICASKFTDQADIDRCKGVFFSGETSIAASWVHAIVMVLVFGLIIYVMQRRARAKGMSLLD